MSDPDRFKFHGDEHYLKTAAEMRYLFREVPEACDNTLWIAERANVEIEFGKPQLPELPAARGLRRRRRLPRAPHLRGRPRAVGRRPARRRSSSAWPTSSRSSATWGSRSYFLIVWDLITPRPRQRHPRRSRPWLAPPAARWPTACASPTSTPSSTTCCSSASSTRRRISMPDIDMDFDSRYRDEMIRYAAERYGRDHVAQIVTFSTIKARAAVRDAARVLGYPYVVGDKVAKAMPPLVMGRDTPLYACLEPHPKYEDGYKMAAELRDMYDDRPRRQAGHRRRQGPRGPAPPGRHPRRRGGDHQGAAHRVPADPAQARGRPGPRGRAGRHPVRDARRRGPRPAQDGLPRPAQPRRHHRHPRADRARSAASTLDIDNVDLDDAPTYELLQRGDSIGVFQLEGGAMRALMRSLAPDGVRGRRRPRGPVPARARWRPTCTTTTPTARTAASRSSTSTPTPRRSSATPTGLMIYQESMMRVAQKFAGYSLAEADNLRKACGKKIRELIAQGAREVRRRVRDHRLRRASSATQWFDIIEPFADYAFNKSHTYGYGLVAYQTAYLKANYPVEYFAAPAHVSVKANLDKAAVYLNECRQMGIQVLVPDVNRSESDFVAVDRSRDGGNGLDPLRAVGGAQRGRGPRRAHRRRARGQRPLHRLLRLLRPGRHRACSTSAPSSRSSRPAASTRSATPARACSRSTSRSSTAPWPAAARRPRASSTCSRRMADTAGDAAVDEPRIAIPDVEFDKRQRLAFEKEMLGLYVTDHPLMGAEASLRRRTECTHRRARGRRGRRRCASSAAWSPACSASGPRRATSWPSSSSRTCRRSIEVMVFPKTMQHLRPHARRRRRGHRQGPGRQARRPAQAHGHGASSGSSRSPTAPRRCASTCRPTRCQRAPARPTSRACSASTPASRRCSCTSASARSCACPTSSASTPPTAWWASCGCCSGPDAIVI